MAVPNVPFWLSAAHTEFNSNRWASNILSLAGVPAPRNCSALAGRSSTITVNLPGGALNDVNVLSYVSGTSGKDLIINVPANAAYRSTTTGGPALRCVIPDAKSVSLRIAAGATVWGKGGNGGNGVVYGVGNSGGVGGPGLYVSSNVTLHNSGSVLGGGGGGGAGGGGGGKPGSGGGGGCSTGAGGSGVVAGNAASTTGPGSGGGLTVGAGGAGGAAGKPGAAGTSYGYNGGAGGAAGPAVVTIA